MTEPMARHAGALRAVLFATPHAAPDIPVPAAFPAALLPLGHGSLAERLVEQLVRNGVTEVDLVACDFPELLRRELGDGGRWGVRLRWHLVKDPVRPYGVLRSAGLPDARRVLIGHADRWPAPEVIRRLVGDERVAVQFDGADALEWSGWASVPGALLTTVNPHDDEQALGVSLTTAMTGQRVQPWLLASSQRAVRPDARGLMQLQHRMIRGADDLPLPAAWITTPWGLVSPQARLHARASFEGPVLIGPGCLVEDGARIGPHTVLTRNVVVGCRTSVSHSLVLPGTYLGQGLEVSEAIVNGERIRHLRLGVEASLPRADGLMLNLEVEEGGGPSLAGRLAAALAVVACSPLLAACVLARPPGEGRRPWTLQPVVVGLDESTRRPVVRALRCPRPGLRGLQRLAAGYGGLLDVVLGRRCWFGVRLRRSAEWYALSAEWQSLLARAPVGLLHAPAWAADDGAMMEACAAADAFYAVRRDWRENLRLVGAALRTGTRPRGALIPRPSPASRPTP